VAVAILVFGAMLVYFAVAFAIGGADIGMIRRNMRRRGKPAEPPKET
jgi:putative peptidoglycan lipid II flippase